MRSVIPALLLLCAAGGGETSAARAEMPEDAVAAAAARAEMPEDAVAPAGARAEDAPGPEIASPPGMESAPSDGGGGLRIEIHPADRRTAGAKADLQEAAAHFRRATGLFRGAILDREQSPAGRQSSAQRFREAAREFIAAAEAGAATTEVFTNAANSFYFAGDRGRVVLFYRRALALDPGNSRARQALEHIRESLPIRRRISGGSSLIDAFFFWHDERSFVWRLWAFTILFPAAWILVAVEMGRKRWPRIRWLLALVLPLALVALALSYLFRLRRPFGAVGLVCLLPAVLLFGSLAADAWTDDPAGQAVVLVEVQGRNGDGAEYTPSHTSPFPPGTEVVVLERRSGARGGWIRVRLLDGSESWLPSGAVETVRAALP